MNIKEKLVDIKKVTETEFENENYDWESLEKIFCHHNWKKEIPQESLEKTPLANFEKQVKEIMDNSGYEYKLDMVSIYPTCDGDCFEIHYCLSWFDNKQQTMKFKFETLY